MNQPTPIQTAMRILLLAGLVVINAFPFFINSTTSYEIIFFSLSAIHAELCLFVAWSILIEKHRRYGQIVWCFLGTVTAIIAATRLFPGQWTSTRTWLSILLGIGATLPAMLPMAAILATQRYCAGTRFVSDSATDRQLNFRLTQLFALTTGCAFIASLLRMLVKSPAGWLATPDDTATNAAIVSNGFFIGLLAAPVALIVLRPNRYCLVWLVYFIGMAALAPFLDRLLLHFFQRPVGGVSVDPGIAAESYFVLIWDNITWYGPQLLPTALLFVLLRLTGIRVQHTK